MYMDGGGYVVNEEKLSAVLSEFARTMITDFPIQGILDHLVERIVEVLPVTSAGVTLISAGDGARYIAASDEVGAALRAAADRASAGAVPRRVRVRRGRGGQRPAAPTAASGCSRPPAVDAGLAAVFTFPVAQRRRAASAHSTFYRDTPGALDPHDMAAAQTLADVAAAYLINAQTREEARDASDRFHHARCTTR